MRRTAAGRATRGCRAVWSLLETPQTADGLPMVLSARGVQAVPAAQIVGMLSALMRRDFIEVSPDTPDT